MHMQLDPGSFPSGAYKIEWQNLSLTVPEPATAGMLAGGFGLLLRRRRRS